jgi:hypothetical protein
MDQGTMVVSCSPDPSGSASLRQFPAHRQQNGRIIDRKRFLLTWSVNAI